MIARELLGTACVPDGVELSEDPILHARPGAYAESVLRRSGVSRDTA